MLMELLMIILVIILFLKIYESHCLKDIILKNWEIKLILNMPYLKMDNVLKLKMLILVYICKLKEPKKKMKQMSSNVAQYLIKFMTFGKYIMMEKDTFI